MSEKPDLAAIDAFAQEVVEKLAEEVFEVEGAPLVTVKYPNTDALDRPVFKKKNVYGGWNFLMSYAYTGKRGDVIFGLTPEDAQEWQFAEIALKEMDTIFPLAGAALAKAFGIEGLERFDAVFNHALVEQRRLRAREAETAYQANPEFGMF